MVPVRSMRRGKKESKNMRAFGLTDWQNLPSVIETPKPQAGPGEVLVRVRASSLNGIDLAVAGGMLKGMMEFTFPVVLGKDFAGVVEAVGSGVTRLAMGDPVLGVITHPSLFHTGSFAEYIAVPETSAITRIPDGVDVAQAGALGLAAVAALATVDAVAPTKGETVLVSGATGGVGAFAIQLAAARGADVIATAKPGEDAEFVRGVGAAHAVD
jgi:NADPH:quinone reductase